MLSLSLLAVLGAGPVALEDLFPRVDPAVVTVRVATKTVAQTDTSAVVSMHVAFGSGVLLHADGFVVTAAHVVDTAELIEVHWADGHKADARIITLSRTEDLALLKTSSVPKKAVAAVLGDSDALKPGQRLFAIGAPYGLEHSLTAGVVSALRTNERRGLLPRHLVQTDVPINQGNSGGPLFNEKGEVVGIASFMLSQTGGSVGLNFAVPSNTVRTRLFEEALPWVGVALRYIPRDVAEVFNWPFDGGFLVETVRPGSPADVAGLKGGSVAAEVGGNAVRLGGDFILSVNGVPATDTAKVAASLRALKRGEAIHYEVLRGGKLHGVDVAVPDALVVPSLKPTKR